MEIPVGHKECGDCFGSGEVEVQITCPRCHGTQMVGGEICCSGVDEVTADCETCSGLGYIEDENYEPVKP
jgi:DnaJ-class molecular chaperone